MKSCAREQAASAIAQVLYCYSSLIQLWMAARNVGIKTNYAAGGLWSRAVMNSPSSELAQKAQRRTGILRDLVTQSRSHLINK